MDDIKVEDIYEIKVELDVKIENKSDGQWLIDMLNKHHPNGIIPTISQDPDGCIRLIWPVNFIIPPTLVIYTQEKYGLFVANNSSWNERFLFDLTKDSSWETIFDKIIELADLENGRTRFQDR